VPPSCAELKVATGIDICTSYIQKELLFTHPATFGLDFSVLYNTADARIVASVARYYQGVNTGISVEYHAKNGTIRVIGEDGYHDIMTLPTSTPKLMWIPIKLVADFDNKTGLRLAVLMDSYSLVDILLFSTPTTQADAVAISIIAYGLSAASANQYIGHVLLTADEP
jgi:hypothetical protein